MSLGIKREHDFKTLFTLFIKVTQMILRRYKINNREKSPSFIKIHRHLLLPLSLS